LTAKSETASAVPLSIVHCPLSTVAERHVAKRSIEIVISAENRTGTALQQAKAELAGYAADVKRIQSNIAAATRAGDTGAAAGQMGLLGGARERQATLRQEVEGRAALSARLAAYKAEHAAIRASVGATDELAGSHAKVSAEIARSNTGMDTSVQRAISIGKAMMIAHVATKGIEFAASMLEGDFDKAAEAFKRIPIVGEGATAGFGLGQAVGRRWTLAMFGKEVVSGENPAVEAEIARAAAITAEAKKKAFEAGLTPEQLRMYRRGDQLFEVSQFGPSERGEVAREALLRQFQSEDKAEARAKQQAKAEDEAERTREAANANYNNMLAAAAAKGEREERAAAATREAANAEYNNMLAAAAAKGEREERAAAATREAEERAVEPMFRDLRAPGGGVAAQEAGFLTGVGRYSQEANAAKNAETTAKATEKTAKAVEKLATDLAPFASGEFLEWLRKTGRAPVANF
jgi:hypothetical protein